MKLDDRDIVAQQDYTPLSNAELLAHIETYAGLIYDMPLAERGQWQGDIVGPARVLLARAEAAEALAYERLESALFSGKRATDAEMERDELAARVAELEAERAAQQWRTVTEPPEKAGDYSVMVDGWPDSIAAHYGPVLKGSGESWEWVWVDFDGEIIPVIRWQPLPAAMRPAAAGGTWRTS